MLITLKEKHNKKSKKKLKNKQKSKDSKKEKASSRVAEKEYYFPDVIMFKIMPWLLGFAVLLLMVSGIWIFSNNHQYNVAQSRKSMTEGTQLPLLNKGAADKGTLTLGNSILSEDHKQLAVNIKYDSTAHKALSSFGDRYKIWIAVPTGYPVNDLHVKYGFFGTDGSGVLQINSDKPFKNEAFVIMLVDKGGLVTSNQLETSTVDDSDITKSITAQLSNGTLDDNDDANSSSQKDSKIIPPIYYVRLNPYSATKSDINWENNEIKLVDTLFVRDNLKKIDKKIQSERKKLKLAQNTLNEYNQRLAINPDDQTAQNGKQDMEQQITTLKDQVTQNSEQYQKLKDARLSSNILGKEQTKNHIIIKDQTEIDGLQGGNSSGN